MKDDYLISIVMPVYNSKRFLAAAIDSILAQKRIPFQILLVDDGSTDGSSDICDMYAAKHEFITALHKKNGGICDARNHGMRYAVGKYLYFMDNDDTIAPDFFETMEPLLQDEEPDIIMFGTSLTDVVGGVERANMIRSLPDFRTDSNEAFKQYIPTILREGMHRCVWDKLYRREFLLQNNAQFDKTFTHGGEDLCFNMQLFPHVCKLLNVEKVFYEYYIRDDQSTFRKFNPQIYKHSMRNIENISRMLDAMQVDDEGYLDRLYIEYRQRLVLMMLHQNANMTMKEKKAMCRNEYAQDGYSIWRRIRALREYCAQGDISLNKKIAAAMNIAGLYTLQMRVYERRMR